MRIRILSAWPGSPACGTVAVVEDAVAHGRIRSGDAEPVEMPAARPVVEIAVADGPVETAIAPPARPWKRGRR